jgi:carbamoyl-phosphate synthase/aspartate carbamoyltransferase/dihydroorotase
LVFRWFESRRIWAAGLIVAELCDVPSHWSQEQTLDSWLKNEGVPGISGIDTRQLTQMIREKGTVLGKIFLGEGIPKELGVWVDPNLRNLVEEVSIKVR